MDGISETQDAAPTQECHASGSRCRPAVGEINYCIIVPKRTSYRISSRYDENFHKDLDDPACDGDTPGILLHPVPNHELVRPVQLQAMWLGTPSGTVAWHALGVSHVQWVSTRAAQRQWHRLLARQTPHRSNRVYTPRLSVALRQTCAKPARLRT